MRLEVKLLLQLILEGKISNDRLPAYLRTVRKKRRNIYAGGGNFFVKVNLTRKSRFIALFAHHRLPYFSKVRKIG